MSLQALWEEALKSTELLKIPLKRLETLKQTTFRYILLSQSLINKGDTAVRTGNITIDKPSLVLPSNLPTFTGFEEFDNGSQATDKELSEFFYMRGISFPSLKYSNTNYELDLFEGSLKKAEKHYTEQLKMQESTNTLLAIGHIDSWQFSLIIASCHMIENQLQADLKLLLNQIKKK